MSSITYINPYNFMPLGAKKSIEETEKSNIYSGVIEYSLGTKTPLFVTNHKDTESSFADGRNTINYKFFSYDGGKTPVIPANKIRGMLRSYYEMLTNSCLCEVDSSEILHRRTYEKFAPGLIKKVKKDKEVSYELYEALDVIYREQELIEGEYRFLPVYKTLKYREGQALYCNIHKRQEKDKTPYATNLSDKQDVLKDKVYLIKGEDGPRYDNMERKYEEKHCAHLFSLKNENILITDNLDIEALDLTIRKYNKAKRRDAKKPYEEYRKNWEFFKNKVEPGTYFPVYYSLIEDEKRKIILLSPARITIEVSEHQIANIVGDYTPCQYPNFCPACSLFGQRKRKSKIRFTDMQCIDKEDLYEEMTPFRLAIPRIKTGEFYLKRPDETAWFWSYDYWVDNDGKLHTHELITDEKNVARTMVPLINGRKFYWHQLKPRALKQEFTEYSKTMQPVKTERTFTGKVYFDGISKEQLDRLIYLINTGDEKSLWEKEHGYKLGMGKPLGYGSVALCVDRVIVRELAKKNNTISYEENDYPITFSKELFDAGILEQFLNITDFYALDQMVAENPKADGEVKVLYPRKIDEEGNEIVNHSKWFAKNHTGYETHEEDASIEPGQKRIKPRAKSRNRTVYAEYIEPLNPFFQSTGFYDVATEREEQ